MKKSLYNEPKTKRSMWRTVSIIFLLLYSCSDPVVEKLTLFSGNEMTIDYRILIGHPMSSVEKNTISNIIKDTFNEVNQVYNKWNPDSELSQLNRMKAKIKVPLSPELEKLLLQTDKVVRLTRGRFDPTIEPLQAVWKKYLEQGKIPPPVEIQAIAQAIGWEKIHFDQGYFYKDKDETRLDLGGIAKGYCVDLLVERINVVGFKNVFVEWGGEIRTGGQHPDHRPWNIFISHMGNPDPQKAIAILNLHDQAIATSGDYLQNWMIESKGDEKQTFFHIMDPVKLQPLKVTSESIASASVLAPTCAFADGLATAAMMFSTVKEAQEWAEEIKEQFPELSFWLVSRSETR